MLRSLRSISLSFSLTAARSMASCFAVRRDLDVAIRVRLILATPRDGTGR
jgi:hypothetical protein